MNRIPSFEDLSPLKELLYESLDSAILATSKHFEVSQHRYDFPGFFANHVRAKWVELIAPEAEQYNFAIDMSTGSLLLYYKDYVIRLFKAYNGSMPPVRKSDSKARLLFFNHNSNLVSAVELPGFEVLDVPFSGNKIHLVAYYDVEMNYEPSLVSYKLAWLRIACPLAVTRSGVECLWDEPVENPLFIPTQKNQQTSERKDLIFTLREEDNLQEDDDTSTELG